MLLHRHNFKMATSKCFSCNICDKSFSNKSNLNKHKKLMHYIDVSRKTFQCDVCENTGFSYFSLLLQHHVSCHNFQVESTTLEFVSLSEFNAWKSQQEKKSCSKFIKTTGSKRLANKSIVSYYICHRSGSHKYSGKGLRQPKSQGSCKTGKCCLASIESICEADGKISVTYQSRHYGHDKDIGHLQLTDEERASLAAKLQEGVTIQAILDGIRNNVNGGELERIHLTTKKDIRNILQAYGINCPQKLHKDDKTSVDIWVNSLKMKNDSSIRYYKPQGDPDEDCVLMESDFMLVIMTDPQKQLLESLGKEKILIDSTHGTNNYDFHLTSIVCVDEFGAGFPSAFCISTKVDTKSICQFFLKLRDAVGPIHTQVFMSDDASAYYNAWVQTMGQPSQHLLCVWHVDKNWRQNILKFIKGKELQVTMYKSLRILLECSDKIHFHELLKSFLESSSPEIQDFLQYFKNTYASRPKVWAYCYRQKSGLNTNMYLESLHKVIKYCYMDGKKNRRIDQLIFLLFKLIRDKLFERIIKLCKGASSHRKMKIDASHNLAEKTISENTITEGEKGGSWIINSASTNDLQYIVTKENVLSCPCKLNCEKCKACIHTYSCTCLDFLIHFNMCKHIHAIIQRNVKHGEQCVPNISSCTNQNSLEESERILSSVSELYHENRSTSANTPAGKEKTIALVNTLYNYLNKHELAEDQYSKLQNQLSSMITDVQGARTFQYVNESTKENGKNAMHICSRKLVKQARFYSVKKSRSTTKLTMRKPTMHEKEVLKKLIMNPDMEVNNVHSEFDHIY